MMDEVQPLRESADLFSLLTYYAQHGEQDRHQWQPRRDEMPGCEPRKLSRLHGTLLAEGWLEQNTGITQPGSYRLTGAGWRALKRLQNAEAEE
jgi:hypothetical protein